MTLSPEQIDLASALMQRQFAAVFGAPMPTAEQIIEGQAECRAIVFGDPDKDGQ